MHIVIDDAVAAAEEAFSPFGTLDIRPAAAIDRAALRDADALIIRSGVRVTADLVRDTCVRFVGTATSGTDHVDVDALSAAGIHFVAAAGCNAIAVAEYVVAALLWLHAERGHALAERTLAIIGVGHTGGALARMAPALGMKVIACDPPRKIAENRPEFVDFHDALAQADFVSLHVPLTQSGAFPTRGMVDAAALARMRRGAVLINTARGPVVERDALLAARRSSRLAALVVDVWDAEPAIDRALLEAADVLTPHIAGYSIEGLLRGTQMIADALAKFVGRAARDVPPAMPRESVDARGPAPDLHAIWKSVRGACDPAGDARRFSEALPPAPDSGAATFRDFRKGYVQRHEFSAQRPAGWGNLGEAERRRLENLGFSGRSGG